MAIYSDCGLPLKIFVKEQNFSSNNENKQKKQYLPTEMVTGKSAREFYEKIISETSISKTESPVKHVKSESQRNKFHVNGRKFNLHKLAQYNEFETLELVLRDSNICIDAVDDFGWTPLMCAAFSRSIEAVEILLKYKANPNICDKLGNSAISLAKKMNLCINKMINRQESNKSFHKKKPVETFFCDTCKYEFHTDLKTHESSTLHLFNCGPKNPKTFYGIPDCNKGFQLLLKNGWNREKGLGPNECGMKFPIKVAKKNDRTGIGGESIKCGNAIGEISGNHKLNKKRIVCEKRREKCFERNYRLQFS